MWEIYAYQNSDSLFGILNAVAAIAGANDFKGALAIVAFCGFVAAVCAYAMAPQKLQGWQWLASVTLVLSVLFVPRVTVGIIDKTGSSAVTVVDNIPFGLAVFGSLSSTVGNTLTALYETAMQVLPGRANLPEELVYQKNGLLFGNRLIKEASQVVFQDPHFRTDLINFINNCTMYDLASGDIDPDAFAISSDVWPMMSNPNPARFTPISDSSGTPSVATCPQAYQALNARLPAQVDKIQGLLATRMNPTLPGTVAATLIAGQVQQAYLRNGIASAASSAADLIRQNALINAVNDTSLLAGQKINDPASMLLAVGRAQAIAQTNAAWINNGKIAEQALPVIRNTIEAIIYAIFPIVVLLLLMTGGRETMVGLKNYLSVLIWIQLWPPLYAILNYMAMIHASRELAAAASIGGGATALSLMTSSSIYSGAISGEAVVGYMTMSIPLIAWAGLKRMETFGSALIGSVSALQGAVTSATGAAATGNVSMGNTSMDQMSISPVRSSAFFRGRQDDSSGNTYTSNVVSGLTAMKALVNEGPVSRMVDAKVSQQHVIAANSAVAAARSESTTAANEKAAALSEVLMNASTQLSSHNSSHGSNVGSSETEGQRVGSLQQIAKNVARSTGATEQQVAAVAFGGSAYLSAGVPSAAKKISPIDGGAQLNAEARKTYSAAIQQQDQLINSALSSEDKAKFKAFSDTVTRNSGVVDSLVSDSKKGKELSAKLGETVSRSDRAEANLRRQTEFSESVSGAYQRGESISKDLAKDPRNLKMFEDLIRLEQAGSAAELIKMESYIGNIASVPHQLTKNSSLPRSFGDVEVLHSQNVKELGSDKTSVKFDEFKYVVRSSKPGTAVGSASTAPSGESFRADVRATGEQGSSTMQNAVSDFQKRAGVEVDSNGHIYTKRSLFGDANAQVRSDPDIVAEKAKALAEKLANTIRKEK